LFAAIRIVAASFYRFEVRPLASLDLVKHTARLFSKRRPLLQRVALILWALPAGGLIVARALFQDFKTFPTTVPSTHRISSVTFCCSHGFGCV